MIPPANQSGDPGFHTTHWTVVLQARDANDTAARQALKSLCATYWYPLYAFIRRQGANAPEAAVHRLRQRFGALLREQVGQTVSSADEVEEEIRHLISVLGHSQ